FPNLATFTDPGFDNPLNPNAAVSPNITDPLNESFTYDVDWGDGRNAVTGASIADTNGQAGTPSSGTISGSHIYADDGTYTVTVTVHDDNGGSTAAQFTVTVNTVAPSITGPVNSLVVDEGQAFVLSDLGGATKNLGLGLTDPGFDNPLNPNPASPGIADPTHETFTGVTINWGDGTATDALAIVNRSTDLIDGPPTALFQHTPHIYADDGDYTVTITASADNGGALTPQTITIHVNNVTPTLAVTSVASQQQTGAGTVTTTPITPATTITINESGTVNLAASFTDPGFSNPLNPNPASPPGTSLPKDEIF